MRFALFQCFTNVVRVVWWCASWWKQASGPALERKCLTQLCLTNKLTILWADVPRMVTYITFGCSRAMKCAIFIAKWAQMSYRGPIWAKFDYESITEVPSVDCDYCESFLAKIQVSTYSIFINLAILWVPHGHNLNLWSPSVGCRGRHELCYGQEWLRTPCLSAHSSSNQFHTHFQRAGAHRVNHDFSETVRAKTVENT